MDNKAVRVKTYEIFTRAVEEGVEYGIKRAHKHTDTPTREGLSSAVYDAVVNSVCEVFDFPDVSVE